MKLIRCYIENFGKHKELEYTFQDGLNIILEENGWGKTTFATFIKAMFYGLEATTKRSLSENERKHYLPWQGGSFGGSLVFEMKGKQYRIERFFGEKRKDDTYRLFDETTGLESKDFGPCPGEEIFGMDANTFEHTTFVPQNGMAVKSSDRMVARLNNMTGQEENVEGYELAVSLLDGHMKEYVKTGNRGKISDLQNELTMVNDKLYKLQNREQSYEELQEALKHVDEQKTEVTSAMRILRQLTKETSEYDGLKAKKDHYDSLVKSQMEAKSKLDMERLFFEEPELASQINAKKRDAERLSKLEEQYRDEEENIREQEYKKDGLTEQFLAMKKPPVSTMILLVLGILLAALGIFLWMEGEFGLYVPLAAIFVGIILGIIGMVASATRNTKLKKAYDSRMMELDALIQGAKQMQRNIVLEKEQVHKSIENYLVHFQITDKSSFYASLLEIEKKISEVSTLKEHSDEAKKKVLEFEETNRQEMDRIRFLTKPEHSLEELSSEEQNLNQGMVELMSKRNELTREIAAIQNMEEDETDLLQMQEHIQEKIAEAKQQYDLLLLTKEFLKKANEQYKSNYMGTMQENFRKNVEILNGAMMEDVSIDADFGIRVRGGGKSYSVEALSAGYQDMLALCTRFALVEAMFTGEKPFMMLDDPLVNLDAEKIDRAMGFLETMALRHQLIYFTCHESRAQNRGKS
ncbi:MAG: AAA family ATPase [Lachnospiraceae bacterium]|nr:AAA family ATPase [Lachnospiraceae bacterium]